MAGFSTALVPALLKMLGARGHPVDRVIRELELPSNVTTSPDVEFTPAQVRRLGELAERGLEDPFVGVHAAEQVARGTYGLAEFITRSSANLREALEGFARYSRLLNDHLFVRLEARGDDIACEQRLVGLGGDPGRHQGEFMTAVQVAIGRQILQRPWAPKAVWFTHAPLADTRELERYFGTANLEFGKSSFGLLADRDALAWPVHSADPQLRKVLSGQAEKELVDAPAPDDLAAQVRSAIRAELCSGPPRVGTVAQRLHLSARTLQRRLTDEGLSFQALADEVRSSGAKELIAQPQLPLAEVAFRLGYNNFGAFIRAFKGWTGQTPGEFRAAQRR
ncbi:MAG: AraC family transcriptional regulator [Deltaproteobacteria bacterium]|nr:AraC family transcriptional regulator [Deltaproteobacteria bacterium]